MTSDAHRAFWHGEREDGRDVARDGEGDAGSPRKSRQWLFVAGALILAVVYGGLLVDRLGWRLGVSLGVLFAVAIVWVVRYPGGPREFSRRHPVLDGCFLLPIAWVALMQLGDMDELVALAWSAGATGLLLLSAWGKRRRLQREANAA